MKIVHLCLSCFYIDNYSYQENMLPKYHVKQGHDVTVIASLVSFDKNGKSCLLKKESIKKSRDGYKVIRIDYFGLGIVKRINRILRIYKNLYKILLSEKPDVLFVHGMTTFSVNKVIRYKIKHPNVKVYADSHTDGINSARNWLSKKILHGILWKYCVNKIEPYLEKCYGVLPLRCEFLKEMYHMNPRKIKFLPMGIDDDLIPLNKDEVRKKLREELKISSTSFVIITGGKIDKLKNTQVLIKSFLENDNSNVHLIIFGVIVPDFKKQLRPLLNHERIHFVGWLNAQQVMDYMCTADIACLPGTHSTLWEQSVGFGLPCIFKKWKGMQHVNVNDNCVFVQGEIIQELADVISSLTFTERFKTMKQNATIAKNTFLYSEISSKSIL